MSSRPHFSSPTNRGSGSLAEPPEEVKIGCRKADTISAGNCHQRLGQGGEPDPILSRRPYSAICGRYTVAGQSSVSCWNTSHELNSSFRIWATRPAETWNLSATSPVRLPTARDLAIRRFRRGNRANQSLKSMRKLTMSGTGAVRVSSITASCQAFSSRSK
jgi:hypothetical protein